MSTRLAHLHACFEIVYNEHIVLDFKIMNFTVGVDMQFRMIFFFIKKFIKV